MSQRPAVRRHPRYHIFSSTRHPAVSNWPIQDIVLFLGLCARINTIRCAPTLCLGTPPHPVIARTIAQYKVSPPTPRYCNIYHTILALAISFKGQVPIHSQGPLAVSDPHSILRPLPRAPRPRLCGLNNMQIKGALPCAPK